MPPQIRQLDLLKGFSHRSGGKESAYNAGDPGSIPGSGRYPGEGMATHNSSILGLPTPVFLGFPGGSDGMQCGRPGFDPWVGKIPWRKIWQPNPVLLLGEFPMARVAWKATVHGGYKESDRTEQLSAQHTCLKVFIKDKAIKYFSYKK